MELYNKDNTMKILKIFFYTGPLKCNSHQLKNCNFFFMGACHVATGHAQVNDVMDYPTN